MNNTKIIDIYQSFSETLLVRLNEEGQVKEVLINSLPKFKLKKNIYLRNIFSLEDRDRVDGVFQKGIGEESKYLKLSSKYSKSKKFVNLCIKDIKGKTYAYIVCTESQREKEIRYESKLKALSDRAELDQLTGLLNRHGYWERVKRILNCGDPDRKIGILFIDMDGLRDINNNKGHKQGDKAINQISTLISKCIRERDIAVRYGGDEFVVVVEELSGSKSSAYGLAKRLVKSINEKKASYMTTISIGVHSVKVGDIFKKDITNVALHRKWEEQVVIADKMTYKAKESGKNTVIFSQKET